MTRALSLTCAALLLLIGLSGVALAGNKPSIAVLGLEVVDQNGTPTAQDTQAAKELTDGLRARAKAGTGAYQLAPMSDKELIDQKLLNNCDSEAATCMSAIGNQLGADMLLFGKLEKQGKNYQVSLKLLDVGGKKVLKQSSQLIPITEASGAPLQGWAKRIYANLTGESSGGTIVVKVANADRGTILVDGEPKGSISNGTGSVSGLQEGRTVRIGVESEGFRRWEKDVTVSGSSTIPVELEKAGSGETDVGVGPTHPGTGPGEGPEHPAGGKKSKALAIVGTGLGVVMIGGGLYWSYDNYYNKGPAEQDRQHANCYYHDPKDIPANCTPADPSFKIKDSNDTLDGYTRNARIGWGIAVVGAGLSAFSIWKLVSSDGGDEKQAVRGKRHRKDRTFVVTPIASPKGGGATLRIDW